MPRYLDSLVMTRGMPLVATAAVPRLLRLAVLIGTVAGVLAMHGLGDHGAMHHPLARTAVVAPAVSAHGGHASSAVHQEPAENAAETSPRHGTPGGVSFGLLALCMAILTLSTVSAFRMRPSRLLDADPIGSGRSTPCPASRRDRDPPCLFALSILRC